MNTDALLWLILGIYLIGAGFEQYLAWLNLKHWQPEPPKRIQGEVDAEKYRRSHEYHQVRYRFRLIQTLISLPIVVAILAGGGLGWLDAQLREVTTHPIGLPLLFFMVLYLASTLFSLPFQWFSTFRIEENFGFNKSSSATFWLDQIKSLALTVVLGGLVLGVMLALAEWLGQDFWLWFWIFVSGFMLLVNLFYTSVLLPLFNRLKPLEEGSLRSKIKHYASEVQFPLTQILVMDGSRRSSKANAFFSGLGSRKKVVLFDTLIEKHSEEELVSVLAHEVGHYKRNHIVQGLLIGIFQTGLTLFILSRFIQSAALSQALGGESYAIHLNLIAFGLLYSPISSIIGLGMNFLSRKNEYEADAYAAQTFSAKPLQEALIRLHSDSLSNLTPHPWFVFFHYSHPTLLQRLEALDAWGEPKA